MDIDAIRQAIEASDDLPLEMFPTPEWPSVDGHLFVRGLTGTEQDEREVFLANAITPGDGDSRPLKPGTKHVRAFVVVRGLVNADGQRVFGDSESEMEMLGKKHPVVLDRAYDRIVDMTGTGKKAQEELEKNSEPAPGDS